MHRSLLMILLFALTSPAGAAPGPPSSQGFEAPEARADRSPLSVARFVAPVLKPEVVRSYPHDPSWSTQGLVIDDRSRGWESSGGLKTSRVRQFDINNGKTLQERHFAPELWCEGLCELGQDLLLLTWQNRRLFEISRTTLETTRSWEYFGEGWGVTGLRTELALSDGGSSIHILQPDTLKLKRDIQVRDGDQPIDLLNELELVRGLIYANVWLSDYIAIIDPGTGRVLAWLDCRALLSADERRSCGELNGIAYDAARDEIHLTGKLWPRLVVIRRPSLVVNP